MTVTDWNSETHPFKATWVWPAYDRLGSNHCDIEFFATEQEAKDAICKPFLNGYKCARVEFLDNLTGKRGKWVRKWKRDSGKSVKAWS